MPLRDTQCGECGFEWEQMLRPEEKPEACPHCDSKKVTVLVSAHGGYQGNFGGGSTRPRHSASFRGRRP
jgi:putative FmdB family regulatory protein